MTYGELYETLRSAKHATEIGSAAAEVEPGGWASAQSDGVKPVTVTMQLVEAGPVHRLTVSVVGHGAGSTHLRVSTCDAEGRRYQTSTAFGGRASLELEALTLPLIVGIGSQAALRLSNDPVKRRLAGDWYPAWDLPAYELAAASRKTRTRIYEDEVLRGIFRLYVGNDEQGKQLGTIDITLHKKRTDIPETTVEAVDRNGRHAVGSFDESGVAQFEIASNDIEGLAVRLLPESQ